MDGPSRRISLGQQSAMDHEALRAENVKPDLETVAAGHPVEIGRGLPLWLWLDGLKNSHSFLVRARKCLGVCLEKDGRSNSRPLRHSRLAAPKLESAHPLELTPPPQSGDSCG